MIKRIGLFFLSAIFLFSCGKKGPLLLEPELNPSGIIKLEIFQIGYNIKLQWDFPKTLADKKRTPLEPEKIDKIYIYYSDKEILGGKFRKKATLLKKLKMEDLTLAPAKLPASSSSSGKMDTQNLTYFLNLPFKLKELDNKLHFFGVQYYYQKKKSPISKIVSMVSNAPVKPVTNLKLIQENKLNKLSWNKPEQDDVGKSVSNISSYNIYKKIESDEAEKVDVNVESGEFGGFTKCNRGNILTEYYEDMDTGLNGKYTYYVSAVISNEIESVPSETVSIMVADIFPPEIPANLVCFKASDHLFLTWRPVIDTDFSHYRVYRRLPLNNEFLLVADNVTSTSYKDKDLRPGKTYFYVVTSVDAKGNESEYSNEVKEQF
jgi:fibronectin type 3 domain-containing protein